MNVRYSCYENLEFSHMKKDEFSQNPTFCTQWMRFYDFYFLCYLNPTNELIDKTRPLKSTIILKIWSKTYRYLRKEIRHSATGFKYQFVILRKQTSINKWDL